MKTEFINLFRTYIKRDGAENLLDYLQKNDFFTAPASKKFHSSFDGGLCVHSVNVYYRLVQNAKNEYGDEWEKAYSHETLAIAGLLHDVCKVNSYACEVRNIKVNGVWTPSNYYVTKEKFPYGHGEKSVFIISNYMRLTHEEAMAINWHMGGFDERVKGGSYSISEAYDKYKLCVLLHVADLEATYLDEMRGGK